MEKYRGLTRKSGRRHVWTGKVRCDPVALDAPRSWRKPRRIFVNSMSDLFHEEIPAEFVARVWSVMRDTPRHTYQILTKRPDRMLDVIVGGSLAILPNVWLGTSVEDDRVLDRIDSLRRVPALIRFVSFEPLIGSVADADLGASAGRSLAAKADHARGRCGLIGSTRSRRCASPPVPISFSSSGAAQTKS